METLKALPDFSGKRFGQMTLGYDRAMQVREEFSTLLSLAALVLGKHSEAVTLDDVRAFVNKVTSAMASAPDDTPVAKVIACVLVPPTDVPTPVEATP